MKQHTFYKNRIADLNIILVKAQRKYHLLSLLRLFFFVSTILTFYFLWGSVFVFPIAILCFTLFLIAVSYSVDAKYERDKMLILIEINANELQVLEGDWSMFDEGNEFKDSKHPFTHDLDIFGPKSIFQLLNRTVSIQGKNTLAHTLMYGAEKIGLNNKAIQELTNHLEWCQEFMSEGVVLKKDKGHPKSLGKLRDLAYTLPAGLNFFRFFLPILALSSLTLLFMGKIDGIVFSTIFSIVLLPVISFVKHSNRIALIVTDQSARIKIVLKQLKLFKSLKIKDSQFQEEQATFFDSNESVLSSINEFNLIIKRFEFRLNLLVGILLNFLFCWDFQMLYQLDKWMQKNVSKIDEWEAKIAEIEVWISGAVFKYNNNDSCFTTFKDKSIIDIKGIGHPFVNSKKKVKNDVTMKENENFLIITGPNMAGKSTYLRSLGLIFVFSNAGFPVLADACEIPFLRLYSSMRTSDDLTVESSYFHAELMRLRFIVDAIESGERVFIILDEILKGTNSKDKEIGSSKFLQKLTKLKSKGVIATHDLSLCNLANESVNYVNRYFDSTIVEEELFFSYQINNGICQNMNASFLLKKMNLVD
ncbi:MAG: hypothetical protein HYR91_11715 [Flavobacteriia bacterium]|nr:hypothetical protein [Flavobacteriia bacterium]